MATQQTNKTKSTMNAETMEEKLKPGQINFTLKVAATDLPLKDPKFKMKLIMDFGPEFNSDLTAQNTGPNFNAKRVQSILEFVSDEVIKKIVEFVNFRTTKIKPGKLITRKELAAVKAIYANRTIYRKGGNNQKTKPGLAKEERYISQLVNKLIKADGRVISIEEKNIARIRFEELSPTNLWANAQTIVNGDMEPPKKR